MMACCAVLCLNRITQFCLGYRGLWDCKGICFSVKENKRHLLQSFNAIANLSFRLFIGGRRNCVEVKWFRMLRDLCTPPPNRNKPYYWRPCLSCFISFTLPLPSILSSKHCHRASSKKRLLHNSRCRGWGPHLGGYSISYPILQPKRGAFSFTPSCGAYQKETLLVLMSFRNV